MGAPLRFAELPSGEPELDGPPRERGGQRRAPPLALRDEPVASEQHELAARLGDSTSIHLGVAAATLRASSGAGLRRRLGSVAELGLAPLPLLRFQASARWSVDLHASLEAARVDRDAADWSTTLLAGGSAVF